MSLTDIVSILVAAVCLPGIPLYLWVCSHHVEKLCNDCRAIIRVEQTPIVIEAHNGMSAQQLDALVDEMEALRDQRITARAS